MLVLSPIQTTLYSPSREFVLARIIGIIDRYFVSVIETSFRRVGLLLFEIFNSIPRTQSFQLTSQLPKRYLDKILIIRFPNIDFLFDTWVIANYQFTYLMLKAIANYYLCCFVQIVSNTVVTPLIESSLRLCQRLDILFWCAFLLLVGIPLRLTAARGPTARRGNLASLGEHSLADGTSAGSHRRVAPLFVFLGLKLSIAFVVPLINAFESFAINQKLMPISIDTSCKVVYSQINSNSFIRIYRCFYFSILINVLNLKPSSGVFGMYSYLLNLFVFKSFWQLDFYLTIFPFKLARHGDTKLSIFEPDSRNNQREISFFGQVSRQLWLLVATSKRYSFKQSSKRPHTSIYYFHSLLSDISIKQPIILIRLTNMIVRFVSQTFSLLEKILSAFVQCHIKKILTQTTQSRQDIKFLFIKSSELVLLGGVHSSCFRYKINFTAKTLFCIYLRSRLATVSCFLSTCSLGFPQAFIGHVPPLEADGFPHFPQFL